MASAAAPAREYNFNNDPAIINFTWEQLLEYNKAFLREEKKSTFYRDGPLFADQGPSDLIELHDLGVFTISGQGTHITEPFSKDKIVSGYQHRAYLVCFMPLDITRKFVSEAQKDPEIIFEVSYIKLKRQLYLSDEIRTAWTTEPYDVVLTRGKESPSIKTLEEAEWFSYTVNEGPMEKIYVLEDKHFRHWGEWVEDGLCYVFITDKEFGQEPKSMPARVVSYITGVPMPHYPRHFKRFYVSQPGSKLKYENISNSIENYDGVPICDTIGLRQHHGECWSDAIQQLILFSDGIKEKSQPFFINNTKDTFTSHLKTMFEPKILEDVVSLLMLIKKRFVHRYQSLKEFKNGEHGFECLLEDKNPLNRYEKFMSFFDTQSKNKGKLKRTTSGFLGVTSANLLKTLSNGNNGSIIISAGANSKIYLLAVGLLLKSIGVQFDIVNINIQPNILDKFDTSNVNATMVNGSVYHILGLSYFDATYPIEKSKLHFVRGIKRHTLGALETQKSKEHYEKQGEYIRFPDGGDYAEIIDTSLNEELYKHLTCFYKCNSKLYYYDNNYGIFETPPGLDIDNINGIFLDIHKNIYFVDITFDTDITDLNLFHEGEMKSIKDENVQKILTNPEQPLILFMKFDIYHHITVKPAPLQIVPTIDGNNVKLNTVPTDKNSSNNKPAGGRRQRRTQKRKSRKHNRRNTRVRR